MDRASVIAFVAILSVGAPQKLTAQIQVQVEGGQQVGAAAVPPIPLTMSVGQPVPLAISVKEPITVAVKEPETLSKPEFLNVAGLTEFGFGVGVALATITQWATKDKVDQQDAMVAAMPYLTIIPGYWGLARADLTRQYCARKSLTLSRSKAQDVTNTYALRRARREYEKDRKNGKTTASPCAADDVDSDWASACVTANALLAANTDLSGQQGTWDQEIAISRVYAGWDPQLGGDCMPGIFPTWLGFYIGMPVGGGLNSNYKSERGEWRGLRSLDAKARVSFGVAIVPSPYLNLLVGLTRVAAVLPARNEVDDPLTTLDESKNLASQAQFSKSLNFTVAVGGTFDLLGAIFKAL